MALGAALLAVWLCTRNAHRKSAESGLPLSEASQLQFAPRRSPLLQFARGVYGVLLPPKLLLYVWCYSVRHADGVKSVSRDLPSTWPAFDARVKEAIHCSDATQVVSEDQDELTTEYVRFESTGAAE